MGVPREHIGSASPKDGKCGTGTKGVCSVLHTELGGLGKRTEGACLVLQTGTKGVGKSKGKTCQCYPGLEEWCGGLGECFSCYTHGCKMKKTGGVC